MFNELKKSNMFPVVVTAIILLITLPVLMTIGVIKKHRGCVRVTVNLIEPNEPNDYGSSEYDINVNLFTLEPCTKITISCENGEGVIIDYGGDEVVVTGASEEGAKIFFEYVKNYMDAYLESKMDEPNEVKE